MRAVLLETPESLLLERRRAGADRWDEVWDGVLHMLPPPSFAHQRFGTRLLAVLAPLAEARGLEAAYETGLFRPGAGDRDYRVPDLVFARPAHVTERGVEGPAELVVEILSEGDETYEKLPFYAELGVREVLVIHPTTRVVELFVRRGNALLPLSSNDRGEVRSEVLDVSFQTIAGPRLKVQAPGGVVEI